MALAEKTEGQQQKLARRKEEVASTHVRAPRGSAVFNEPTIQNKEEAQPESKPLSRSADPWHASMAQLSSGGSHHPMLKEISGGKPVQLRRVGAPAWPLQAKLKVGEANDRFEQEADQVADKVVQQKSMEAAPPATPPTAPPADSGADEVKTKKVARKGIQRKPAGVDTTSAPKSVEQGLESRKGKGSPLSPDTQSQMEGAIGADFSGVRVHTDSEAVQMSQDLNAQAFTHGGDIYFNQGKFNPGTKEGDHLLAHELTHTMQQGAAPEMKADGGGGETVQLKPSDNNHPEDGANVKNRMDQAISEEVSEDDLRENSSNPNSQDRPEVDDQEKRSKTREKKPAAQPDVDRPAIEQPRAEQSQSQLEEATVAPPRDEAKGDKKEPEKPKDAQLSPAEEAASRAEGAFGVAESTSPPERQPEVEAAPVVEPLDGAGKPLPMNEEAERDVQALNMSAMALREHGHEMQVNAVTEEVNAHTLEGNVGLLDQHVAKGQEGIGLGNEHLAFRQEVSKQGREGQKTSEEKQSLVESEAPRLVDKSKEGMDETGPMKQEAKRTANENDSKKPDDDDGAEDSKEQGKKLEETSKGAENLDTAVSDSKKRSESLVTEAAEAKSKNTETDRNLSGVEESLAGADTRLKELQRQNQAAIGEIGALRKKPNEIRVAAHRLDGQGMELVLRSKDIEERIATSQKTYQSTLAEAPQELEAPKEVIDLLTGAEGGAGGGAGSDVQRKTASEEGSGDDTLVQRTPESGSENSEIQRAPEDGYEDRREVDLLSAFAQQQEQTDVQRQQTLQAAEERRQADLAYIRSQSEGGFERLNVLDKGWIALKLMGRNLFGGLSNIKMPSAGELLVSLFNPVVALRGVVAGLNQVLGGAANLFSLAQWKKDPIGNLLKSAADIATGITVILGSITALAGIIIAIMTALIILTWGFAAPVAGPVISFCASVLVTVGGWTIAVGKVALLLQALVFIKNLIEAMASKTAEDLRVNSNQMTSDARNFGNAALQIGMAKLGQIGGRNLQTRMGLFGSPTTWAADMPRRFLNGGRNFFLGFGRAGSGISNFFGAAGRLGPRGLLAGLRTGILKAPGLLMRGIGGGLRLTGRAIKEIVVGGGRNLFQGLRGMGRFIGRTFSTRGANILGGLRNVGTAIRNAPRNIWQELKAGWATTRATQAASGEINAIVRQFRSLPAEIEGMLVQNPAYRQAMGTFIADSGIANVTLLFNHPEFIPAQFNSIFTGYSNPNRFAQILVGVGEERLARLIKNSTVADFNAVFTHPNYAFSDLVQIVRNAEVGSLSTAGEIKVFLDNMAGNMVDVNNIMTGLKNLSLYNSLLGRMAGNHADLITYLTQIGGNSLAIGSAKAAQLEQLIIIANRNGRTYAAVLDCCQRAGNTTNPGLMDDFVNWATLLETRSPGSLSVVPAPNRPPFSLLGGGITEINYAHFMKRHTIKHFDFREFFAQPNKPTTFFPAATTEADIVNYVEQSLTAIANDPVKRATFIPMTTPGTGSPQRALLNIPGFGNVTTQSGMRSITTGGGTTITLGQFFAVTDPNLITIVSKDMKALARFLTRGDGS